MAQASDKTPKFTPNLQSIKKFWLETDVVMTELTKQQPDKPDSQFVELNQGVAALAIASVEQQERSEQIPNRLKNEPPR